MVIIRTNKTPLQQLRSVLVDGDISLVLLLGGFGLILWALFGLRVYTTELDDYAKLFSFGSKNFWFLNYIFCGLGMWALVAYQYPPTISLLLGTWCAIIWSWSALGRLSNEATFQTGNATSVVYVIIGLLIIQRTAKLRE